MSWETNYLERARRKRLVLQSENIIAYDSFNRPDSDTLGLLDTGQVWDDVNALGKWGIRDNAAVSIVSGVGNRILFDSGLSNGRLKVRFKEIDKTPGTDGSNIRNGVIFRGLDIDNHYEFRFNTERGTLYRREGGAVASLASTTLEGHDGIVIDVVFESDQIEVYANGTLVLSYSDPTFIDGKKNGLYITRNTTTKVDVVELEGIE